MVGYAARKPSDRDGPARTRWGKSRSSFRTGAWFRHSVTAEVDVAVFGRGEGDRDVLLAIGEAKWQETMSASHLKRLEHIRELLVAKGEPGAQDARLLLFGGAG